MLQTRQLPAEIIPAPARRETCALEKRHHQIIIGYGNRLCNVLCVILVSKHTHSLVGDGFESEQLLL